MVAYAPTEETPEGPKAKFMAALNCTEDSVPARECVFVFTNANGRIGKSGEGKGEADSKVLGAYGRDKLNGNGKLLLGLVEDKKIALLLHPQKKRVLYVTKVQPQQGTRTFGLYPDKAGGPPSRPLRQCPPASLRGTRIRSQHRVRQSPHPTQVRTKPEEKG